MLRFTSTLKADYSDQLERLMFFNPGQQNVLEAIVSSVEKFGAPSVYVDGDCLRVKVEKYDEVQTLFSLSDDKLVGVLVYTRVSFERLYVIHIAVAEDYSSHGKFAQNKLVIQLMQLLRKNARFIKGIKTVRIMFSGNRIRDFSV